MKQRITLSALLITVILLGIFIFNQTTFAYSTTGQPYQTDWIKETKSDSGLYEIEKAINQAFAQSMIAQTPNSLQELHQRLEGLHEETQQDLVQYWISYLQFYQAIYHLQAEEGSKSEKVLKAGINRLKGLKSPNSEDYALLAMMESFSIQFAAGIKAPFISNRVKKYAEQALAMDAKNPRAYFVLASNDYYTPEQYGGRQKAEEYLKKALELPAQAVPNPYLPAWGRAEAHEMLIRLYISQERWEEAKGQFQAAQKEFPESYTIQQLASQLVAR